MKGTSPWLTWSIVLAAAGAICFLILQWPIPQWREAQAKRHEQIRMEVEKQLAAARATAELIEDEKQRKRIAAIGSLSDGALKTMIQNCRNMISRKVSKPFVAHFPDYSASQLRSMTDMAMIYKMKLGRPSTVLEGFDVDAFNIQRLRSGDTPDIELVAEYASDSFSGPKRWVGVFTCSLDDEGAGIKEVTESKTYPLD